MQKLFSVVIVAICLQGVLSYTLPDDENGEYCEECSRYFDEETPILKEKITELLPFTIKAVGHCTPCVFTGVENFFRIPDKPACVTENPNGDIIRHMFVEFPNVTVQCHCEFSEDPVTTIKKVLETIADPIISACVVPHMAKNVKDVQLFPDKIDTEDVESLQECIPAATDVIRQKEPIADFKLGLNFQNSRYSFDLVTKPGSKNAVIKNTKVLIEDTSNWKQQCEGPESIVKACKCFLETKYLSYSALEFIKFGIPCGVEKRGQFVIRDLVNEMACPV